VKTLPSGGLHPLSHVSAVALAFMILLCYGGGFGIMPAFARDYLRLGHPVDLWSYAKRPRVRELSVLP
jgi:hypothetical protein